MAEVAERLARLTPKQRALLRRRRQTIAAGEEAAKIPRRPGPRRAFPLSFSQLRQWILEELEPGTAAYNLPIAVRLEGPLDRRALARAFATIVARHESLRTGFVASEENGAAEDGGDPGEPVQVVSPPGPVALPDVDLRALPAARREAAAADLAARDARRPFDLGRPGLLRLALARLDELEHVLLFTLHHIVSDAWSRGVFFRELEELYGTALDQRPPRLPELPIQYGDFASWQRLRLRGAGLERLLAHWRRQLADPPPPLELPTDRPRPSEPSSRGATVHLEIAATLTAGLREIARTAGASLFMTLLAAWDALLYRLTSQSDLVTGTFIANRTRSEIAPLIGFFVNTLALRVRLPGNGSFDDLLAAAKESTLGAFAHQELPFEKILEELQPVRDTRHTPYFQTMLVLQNARRRELELPGLEASYLPGRHPWAHFDLTLWLWERPDTLTAALEYRTDLFDETTAERLLGHFNTLLAGIVEDPGQPLPALPILSAAETAELRTAWNADAAPLETATAEWTPVHRTILETAARRGDATALIALDAGGAPRRLSYGELAAAARRLAARLRQRGAAPKTVVAIALERSPEWVVALLAVLEAGAGYLPLDLAAPDERLAFLLADSRAALIITRREHLRRLGRASERALLLDEADDEVEEELPRARVACDHSAYVIYTSGSTGRPKGVVIPHRALAAYTTDAGRVYALAAQDRALQFASLSFDTSAEEIYPALAAGATLVLRDEAMTASVKALLEALDEHRVSLLNLPTAYWHEICAELEADAELPWPRSVERVIIGGEKALPGALYSWQRRVGPAVRLWNTYGPTEATIVTLRAALGAAPTADREVPLGRPLDHARICVVDQHLRPVPPGVTGELLIGGPGLARAYLGRPGRTAASFVPDFWSGRRGERLYKSGDLVAQRPEGLEFHGRRDHQVKIRGYRVELGEIEATLAAHPAVSEATVLARVADDGDVRLLAWIGADPPPSTSELRTYLGERLPEYMVPAHVTTLPSLPKTPAGKIDRRSLGKMTAEAALLRPELETPYEAPRSPSETLLAEIWANLLGIDRVGRRDNFFALGGHSLLVTRLASRLRQDFEVEIPLLRLFNVGDLAEMGREIERAARAGDTLPPITRASREADLPLAFPQERIWFLTRLMPENPAYNFHMVIDLEGRFDPRVMKRVLDEMVRRHEIYSTTFPPRRDAEGHERPVQHIHPPWKVNLEVIDLRRLPEAMRQKEGRRLVDEQGQTPFDLSRLPLIRWRLLRLEDEHWALSQTEQHLVHDGWSVAVFLRETQALYAAFSRGEPSPLGPMPIQFADFAAWQRRTLSGDHWAALRDYWTRRLTGCPGVLELPSDRPRPPLQTFRGGLCYQEWPAETYDQIRAMTRREGLSLYMAMLAAFYALLHRYTGETDMALGAGVANRRRQEAEALIGMIVNTVVLRGRLDGDPSFRQLARQVRHTTLEAYAHQDMPFERLVRELEPKRDPSRNPIFQVMFSFHDSAVPDIVYEGPGGRARGQLRGAHNRSAKVDLNVVVMPHGEQKVGLDGGDRALILYWEYNSDLFDRATIGALAEHYRRLLTAAAASPGQRISALPMLGPEERRQILDGWNPAPAEYPRRASISELFAARAAEHSGKTALVFGERRVSYGELATKAGELARQLRAHGVGPEVVVGLAIERSPELVVAILGILGAGGAYLPLDPDYPPERLAFMLEDTEASLVVCAGGLPPSVAEAAAHHELEILDIDSASTEGSPAMPRVEIPAEALAYVMYTSGSTGRPKGVAVSQRNVVRLVHETNFARFGAEETFLLFAPTAFDASTLELWGPLLHGGRLVIAPPGRLALEDLGRSVSEGGVTTLWLTAGLFHQMVEDHLESLRGVRQLLAGGDVLAPAAVRRVLTELPGTTLINGYGPTENTTFTTCHRMTDGDVLGPTVPIGRPIAHTTAYVLDRHLQPVPAGVPGELYTGGDGLARGYHARPALTAERFVPHPLAGETATSGARLYRTGDRVRWRRGGVLEFLGRLDFQVKIRGFRIEPGEVQALLAGHPEIATAAVVVRDDAPGGRGLVAYVMPATVEPAMAEHEALPRCPHPRPLSPGERGEEAQQNLTAVRDPHGVGLRSFLEERLPAHMVPVAFVVLDELPLDANGKLDRGALPAPSEEGAEVAWVAPRTALESDLAAIWCEVLERERVGVYDDFFELGGHSLLATQVVSRLRRQLGLPVPLSLIFAASTVERMAEGLEELRRQSEDATAGMTVAASIRRETDAEELVERAAGLADDELDSLLGSMLAEEES